MPELFSAPVLDRVLHRATDARLAEPVPYFDGVTSGETQALVASFAGEPEVHHPLRGRVKGVRPFERFVAETNRWLDSLNAVTGEVERIVTPRRGIEEMVLTVDGEHGRIAFPVAVAADRDGDARILELRVYYGTWPLLGRHTNRPPLLQLDPDLEAPDVVGEYHGALAAGDVGAAVAAFESDAYVREPAGAEYVHRGRAELVALFELFFSNGGGIPLEQCTITDDGRSCAVEYNVVRWGRTEVPPEAGIAIYDRGTTGKLAGARIYNDLDPPIS
jgi:hypothetical protein